MNFALHVLDIVALLGLNVVRLAELLPTSVFVSMMSSRFGAARQSDHAATIYAQWAYVNTA